MDKDTRHALGNGGENELPRPHPFEFGPKRPLLSDAAGRPNSAINSRRPIADMHPDGGSPTLSKGIPFGMPMGEPYDD